MKISWASGIVIAFGTFMSLILFFVFKVQTDKSFDNEMVLENYYQYESQLTELQEKERNANLLKEKVNLEVTKEQVIIHFPKEFIPEAIKGTVSLYRPSDQDMDFEISLSLSSSNLLIPRTVLADGRWDIHIDWSYQGDDYFNKMNINLSNE